MAEVTIPKPKLAEASFGLRRADSVLQLMNGKEVITEFPYAVWIAQLPIVPLNREQGEIWTACLAQLSRISNHFKAGPPGYKGAAYKATTLQVDGAGQLGMELNLKNAQNNALVLRAGEYFEVNGELKIVVANCTADSSGKAKVKFEPPLRAAPYDSANLDSQTPKVKWRLASPEASWGLKPKMYHTIRLDVVEVV